MKHQKKKKAYVEKSIMINQDACENKYHTGHTDLNWSQKYGFINKHSIEGWYHLLNVLNLRLLLRYVLNV